MALGISGISSINFYEGIKSNTENNFDSASMESSLLMTNIHSTENVVDMENCIIDQLASQISQKYSELENVKATEDPFNKMYAIYEIGGNGTSNGNSIPLTGAEVTALKEVFDEVDNDGKTGKARLDSIVEALKEKGIENVSADDKFVIFDHGVDGQSKIHDSNGNGILSKDDCNLNAALTQFKADMDAFNQKINNIQNEITKLEEAYASHEDKRDKYEDKSEKLQVQRSNVEIQKDNYEREIFRIENIIGDIQQDMEDYFIQEENKKAQESKQSEQLELQQNNKQNAA